MTAMWIQVYSIYRQQRYYLLGLTFGTLFILINAQILETPSHLTENESFTLLGTPLHSDKQNNSQFLRNDTQLSASNSSDDRLAAELNKAGDAGRKTDFLDNLVYSIIEEPSLRTIDEQSRSDMWRETMKELREMLLSVQGCTDDFYKCFSNEPSNTTIKQSLRYCACDESCDDYGECCIEKAVLASSFTRDKHQSNMFCGRGSDRWNNGVLMIGECPGSMVETTVDDFCNQKVPLDVYDIIFDIPVVSLSTNRTYRNYFCAFCNNDAHNLLRVDMTLSCSKSEPFSVKKTNQSIEEFLREAKYLPGERKYELPYEEDEPLGNVGFSTSSTQTCEIEVKQYKNEQFFKDFGSRTCAFPGNGCWSNQIIQRPCTRQIKTCNSSWPFTSDFEKCRSYSLVVFARRENVLYKNPHCAECNFVNMSSQQLACAERSNVRFITRTFDSDFPTFSVLFEISDKPFTRCEKENYIWNPLFQKCTEIICGSGRIFRSGNCVKNTLGNSTLQRNCPTVAIDNFTLYENESVYSYVGDILYPKGEYEQYNESLLLVCIEESYYYREFSPLHIYTTIIVLSISLVCLAFHIILYCCFSRMRTFHGKNLLCLCCSLFIAQFLFLTGITATENFTFCVFMSMCLHYFWLSSFCWMNILSIDVWRTFRTRVSHNAMNKRKLFIYYSIYAWGFPFVIVAVGLALDLTDSLSRYRPSYAGQTVAVLCWINSKLGLLCFFLIPVGFIIIENLIFYAITSYRIYVQSKEAYFAQCKSQSVREDKEGEQSKHQKEGTKNQAKQNRTNKIRFALYVKLGLLQGLTWVLGFLAAFINSSLCWFIFTALNGLQGAVIVLCFDIKKWVFLAIWENIFKGPLVSRFSRSTKSTSPNEDPNLSKINKRGLMNEPENANPEQAICGTEEGNEIKVLEGKKASKIWISSSLKRYKDSIAKTLSFGSSVGYKSGCESEPDFTENFNTQNTQETEISDVLSGERVNQDELSTQNGGSENQEISKL